MLGDHLGSASTTANENGTLNSVIQYTAFGEIRLTQGLTPTKYRYTGQLAQAELGLVFYVSRWYDPFTAHFTSADTLIPDPGKSQGYDRYAYVIYSPLRFKDEYGHGIDCGIGESCKKSTDLKKWKEYSYVQSRKYINSQRNIFSDLFTNSHKIGRYLSLSYTIGDLNVFTGEFTYLFTAGSIDFVWYDNKLGVFSSEFVPDARHNSDIPIYSPLALEGPMQEDRRTTPHRIYGKDQFSSFQLGINIDTGVVAGRSLEERGVPGFSGPSTHSGGSVDGTGITWFTSNNSETGEIDNNLYGMGYSFGLGVPPLEGHQIITNSVPLSEKFSIKDMSRTK